MMTVRVSVDGWPYHIQFSGGIDVERMYDGSTVAIRTVGDQSKVFQFSLDEEDLKVQRETIAKLRKDTQAWDEWFHGFSVRAGYD